MKNKPRGRTVQRRVLRADDPKLQYIVSATGRRTHELFAPWIAAMYRAVAGVEQGAPAGNAVDNIIAKLK